MKLEDQVVSLKYAKKLKELGFKQESLWWWAEFSTLPTQILSKKQVDDLQANTIYSAYTVAELGEMLPKNCVTFRGRGWWYCDNCVIGSCPDRKAERTEANARAKMLIYLKENKLI